MKRLIDKSRITGDQEFRIERDPSQNPPPDPSLDRVIDAAFDSLESKEEDEDNPKIVEEVPIPASGRKITFPRVKKIQPGILAEVTMHTPRTRIVRFSNNDIKEAMESEPSLGVSNDGGPYNSIEIEHNNEDK